MFPSECGAELGYGPYRSRSGRPHGFDPHRCGLPKTGYDHEALGLAHSCRRCGRKWFSLGRVRLRKPVLCVQCWKTIPAGTIISREMRVGDMHIDCRKHLDEFQRTEQKRFEERRARGELKPA